MSGESGTATATAVPAATATDVHEYDVLIVGAGLPGLALAVALRGSGLSCALVDRQHPSVGEATGWDQRIYAISPGNARFLHDAGIWPRIDPDRLAAIESMRVLGDREGTQLDFSAFDIGERALAWMIEQRELMKATLGAWAAANEREAIHAGAAPVTLARGRNRAEIRLDDGKTLAARLVVGADGLRSWTRGEAGIDATQRAYGQSAVVANFETENPHHGRAWQWFQSDGGVLAWLPLPGRRMSIVWSAPAAKAAQLLEQDDAAFTAAVAAAGHDVLGNLQLIGARASFPLSFVRPSNMVADRVALIGDAAHGIHPLAGQGLNLGYGDAAVLAKVLRARGPVGDPGSPLLLGRYARERAWPTRSMQTLTDGLWRLFSTANPIVCALRNRGMMILNDIPAAKALLMQPAMR